MELCVCLCGRESCMCPCARAGEALVRRRYEKELRVEGAVLYFLCCLCLPCQLVKGRVLMVSWGGAVAATVAPVAALVAAAALELLPMPASPFLYTLCPLGRCREVLRNVSVTVTAVIIAVADTRPFVKKHAPHH